MHINEEWIEEPTRANEESSSFKIGLQRRRKTISY